MKTSFLYIVLAVISLSACTKENEKVFPGTFNIIPFDVTASVQEVKVGEQVSFQFEGNADTIYFYSGESGKDYNYINGRVVPIENTTIDIQTRSSYGEQSSLYIMLSHDYNGEESYESITAATWKDMTPKFNIPTPKGATNVDYASGPVDISEFIEGDKPYYIGIRNDLKDNTPNNRTTQWYFYAATTSRPGGFAVKGMANGKSIAVVDLVNAEWKIADEGYTGPRESMPYLSPDAPATPTSLFYGRNSPTSSMGMDSWAVTKALSSTVNVAGDKGTLIKRISDLPLTEYKYLYTNPGDYDIVFESINQDGTKNLVRHKITVAP